MRILGAIADCVDSAGCDSVDCMKQIALRLPDELAAAVDASRGQVPRERWIRELIQERLGSVPVVARVEEQAARSVPVPARGVPDVPGVRPAREFVKDPALLARQARLNRGGS
jgi:hypothetical protein